MAIFHSVYTGGAPFFWDLEEAAQCIPQKRGFWDGLGNCPGIIYIYNPETVTSMGIQPVNQKQYQILTSASVLPDFSKIYFKHVGLLLNSPHNVCIVRFTAVFFFDPHASAKVHFHAADPAGLETRDTRWSLDLETAIPPMDWTWYKMGLSENSVPLNPMVLLIIIPIKWLFHWEYTIFSDKPK